VFIDDCDAILKDDKGFRDALSDAIKFHVPIVLTCSSAAAFSEWTMNLSLLHFQRPTAIRLAKRLRAWTFGFTEEMLTLKWLVNLINVHDRDVRAVMNALQIHLNEESNARKSMSCD